ncbi:hypothetical protein [Brunnivagina elsteri]|uniref:hypothetical protein n=1 Tax=Brunnivagina elsteri TaxID=1247191 RepID=UPI0011774D80|nr:hypothetical protein [Calothrix elsteri]
MLNKKEQLNKAKELDASTNSFTNTSGGQSSELFSEDRTLIKQRLPIISTNPESDRTFITKLPGLPPSITAQTRENLPPIPLPVPSPSRLPLPPAPTSVPIPSVPSLSTLPTKKNPIKKDTSLPTQKKIIPATYVSPKVNSVNTKKDRTNSPQKSQNTISKPVDSKTPQPKVSPSPTTKPTVTPTTKPTTKPTTTPTATPTTTPVEEKLLDDIFVKLKTEIEFTEDSNFSGWEKFAGSIPGLKKTIGTVAKKNPLELALILKKQLETKGFQVSQINTYADGFVYEVKKAKFTEYITLTPDVEKKGTIIVTWINPPTDSI